jgi:hypothetical protein
MWAILQAIRPKLNSFSTRRTDVCFLITKLILEPFEHLRNPGFVDASDSVGGKIQYQSKEITSVQETLTFKHLQTLGAMTDT